MNPRRILETALEAARAAVEVHRRDLGQVRVEDWSAKGVADFVTHVDRDAEQRIIERIRAEYPDHAVLAEEGTDVLAEESAATAPASHEWLWIIDPLDGTTNYLHAYPAYAVSIGVLHRGEPMAGVVISGATGEEWSAVRGGGAFRDGHRLHVSYVDRLDRALIGTGFPFRAPDLLPAYFAQLDAVLRRTAGVRRAGSAAIDLCHVATGYLDGFWELVLAPWDIAAGILIIREAGGVAGGLDGDPDLLHGGPVLAGNPVICAALGEVLGSVG